MEGHLERLRRAEIEGVRGWFKPGLRVLDLGGGSGFQANLLASLGCDVLSIDLAGRPSPRHQFYPVRDYDGRNIPAGDDSFDIVFSSNVLEHIQPLPPILGELHRTLKPDGLAIQIVPSTAWRFWTSATHFGFILRWLLRKQYSNLDTGEVSSLRATLHDRGLSHIAGRLLPIAPHGEYPNALAELYYFSRRRWLRVFAQADFDVIRADGNHLFYTGYRLFPQMPLWTRRHLARMLGSACHVFVMQAKPPAEGRFGRGSSRDATLPVARTGRVSVHRDVNDLGGPTEWVVPGRLDDGGGHRGTPRHRGG